jgi:hypothetical protein
MPIHKSLRTLQAPKVLKVSYRNPSRKGRTGKLAPRTLAVQVDGVEVVLHSIPAVAEILRCSSTGVLHLLKADKLRGFRLGRDWIVFDGDLKKYMKRQGAMLKQRFRTFLGAVEG